MQHSCMVLKKLKVTMKIIKQSGFRARFDENTLRKQVYIIIIIIIIYCNWVVTRWQWLFYM